MDDMEKQLRKIFMQLKNDVDEAMENEVAELVIDKEQEHIITDVYNVYNPSIYERREEDGGLLDRDNIESFVYDHTLYVENLTQPNMDYESILNRDDSLSDLIEGGDGFDGLEYYHGGNKPYNKPRPFQQNTIDELEESEEHIKVLENALIKKGYDIDKNEY